MGMKDHTQVFGEAIKNIRDDRVEDVRKFREKLEGKKVPDLIKSKFEEEVGRYLSTDKQHSESNVIRTYLGILSSLPWGVTTEDSIDIENARKILNEGHYGMDDIKQRILELLAVGKLQGKVQGRILCFVGPPGVGKTSIGASIAKYFYLPI
jgi:ATP-dependent Lon protease